MTEPHEPSTPVPRTPAQPPRLPTVTQTAPEPPSPPLPPILLIWVGGLAVLGDIVLREIPWGVNLTIWIIALAAMALVAGHRGSPAIPRPARLLFASACVFAILFSLRDAQSVQWFCVLAAIACLVYGIVIAHGFVWTRSGLLSFTGHGIDVLRILPESGLRRIASTESDGGPKSARHLVVALRGLLLAVPFLAVFTYLFMAADARFTELLSGLFDPEELVNHAITLAGSGAVAWFLLAGILTRHEQNNLTTTAAKDDYPKIGAIEVSVAVGLICVLFAAFVWLQMGYLFGGVQYLIATADLSAADYAKRGFYELATAASIALGALYFLDWLCRHSSTAERRILHILMRVLVVLTAVILLSAIHRMLVYVAMFGLTEQRLMVLVIIGWLAALFVWAEWSVLRNQRGRFAAGAFVAGLAAVAVFALINPHHLIAKTNIARALEGKPLDTAYLSTLSDDAIPALRGLQHTEYAAYQTFLETELARREVRLAGEKILSWNLGSHRARQYIRSQANP